MAREEELRSACSATCHSTKVELSLPSRDKNDPKHYIPLRPFITKSQAAVLAQQLFSLELSEPLNEAKELSSYEDRNFLVKGKITGSHEGKEKEKTLFVLKLINSLNSQNRGLLEAITHVLNFTSLKGIQCPVPLMSVFGNTLVPCRLLGEDSNEIISSSRPLQNHQVKETVVTEGIVLAADNDHEDVCMVRLFTFIDGEVLSDMPWTYELLFDLGAKIARLHKIFKEFGENNPWIFEIQLQDPQFPWDLRNVPSVVDSRVHALDTIEQRNIALEVAQRFQIHVLDKLEKLDLQLIHGDLNEHNIIVGRNSDGELATQGFIDFSHIQHSYRVLDFAIAMGYLMIESVRKNSDVLQATGHMFAGYQSEFPLGPFEINMLLVSAKARIIQSLVMGIYQYKYVTPGNEYVLFTSKNGWKVMQDLSLVSDQEVLEAWRKHCNVKMLKIET